MKMVGFTLKVIRPRRIAGKVDRELTAEAWRRLTPSLMGIPSRIMGTREDGDRLTIMVGIDQPMVLRSPPDEDLVIRAVGKCLHEDKAFGQPDEWTLNGMEVYYESALYSG